MKVFTIQFRRKREKLIKLLTKYKDNEDKYVTYYKELQELYYKYKIKKYQEVGIINNSLDNYIHSHKLKTLKDIEMINEAKNQLRETIQRNRIEVDDIVEKMKVIFTVLEANKIAVEEIQEEIKYIKNIKPIMVGKSRSKVKVEKLRGS